MKYYEVNENITSTIIRINAHVTTIARNQRIDHFTTSFHFLILSSSHSEIVIRKAPYTIAPTDTSARNVASAVVQFTIWFFTFHSINVGPLASTKSLSDKHPSRELQMFPLKAQSAASTELNQKEIRRSKNVSKNVKNFIINFI